MNKQRHDCETIAITVSKQFVANAKEMARLLGYSEDDLGRVIEEYGWTIADALGDLHSDLEDRTWSDEQACRQVAKRVVERLNADTVVRVGRTGDEWIIRFFQKDHPRLYLWDLCEQHGIDFNHCDRTTFHRKSDILKFIAAS
jgi:hypothetical protein